MSNTVIIDDQDLSHVTYSGTWVVGGTVHEHDGTVASSTVTGNFFTVSFTGTSIGVYGTIDSSSGGVRSSYSVDGTPPTTATSGSNIADTYDQQFWQSSTLSNGNHVLMVEMVSVNSNPNAGEGTIWFDYFVTTVPITSSNAISTTSSSSTSTTNPPSSSTLASAPAASSQTTDNPGNPSDSTNPVGASSNVTKKTSVGAIVGGVVAGVIILAIAFLLILLLIRRRKRQSTNAAQPSAWPQYEADGRGPFAGIETRQALGTYSVEPFTMGTSKAIPSTTGSPSTGFSPSPVVHPTRPHFMDGASPAGGGAVARGIEDGSDFPSFRAAQPV